MNLYDWQRPIASRLQSILSTNKTAVVALPTGSGKSYITTAVASEMKQPTLVICPKSVRSMWGGLLAESEAPILDVTNWEKLKTGKTACWKKDLGWRLLKDSVVILDEAHKQCSGPDSQSGKLLAQLKSYPVKTVLVSATMAASPLHMRHTGYLLDLHKWNPVAWKTWLKANKCWYDSDNRYWRSPTGKTGREVMAKINDIIADRLLYMKLADIPGFPETLIQCKLYDLSDRETEEINAAYADMSERMKKKGASVRAEINKTRERTEMLKTGLLAELVLNGVADGNSVVVFLNYREPLFRLKELLNKSDLNNISMIYGGQDSGDSTKNRDEEIRKFRADENTVCLAMAQAGGIAVSLHPFESTGNTRLVFICPSYNASDVKQCLGRVHRMSGTYSVQTFVLAAGTVEERVYRAVNSKLKNINTLNEGLTDDDLSCVV